MLLGHAVPFFQNLQLHNHFAFILIVGRFYKGINMAFLFVIYGGSVTHMER